MAFDPELADTHYDFPQQVDDDAVDEPPHLEILDPWCPYKRIVIRHLAIMAGALLKQVVDPLVAERADGYTGLSDVIYGIELFNEVDHSSSTINSTTGGVKGFDMAATGEAWGRTCFHAAKGLRAVLPESSGIKILLPGLSSYQLSGAEDDTWEGRLTFVQGLAQGFAAEFRGRAEELSSDENEWKLDNIVELFQGMDVHNYHFRPSDDGFPVHCGLLGFERVQIREAILAGLMEAVLYDTDAADQVALFENLPLTVIETTTTVVDPDDSASCGSEKPDYSPYSAITYEQFQAWELWRRLGSALGANAAIAGWHSWMGGGNITTGSPLATNFGGSGLREDIAPTELGTLRPAWTSLQRLAQHLGRASSGSLVLPEAGSRDELMALAGSPTGPADRVVVFEFRVGSASAPESWYYLVLLDPSVQPDASWTEGGVMVFAGTGSKLASVEEHLFLGLNGTAGPYSPATSVTRSLPLVLQVDAGGIGTHTLFRPRLYEASEQLSWETWGDKAKLVPDAPAFVREPAVIGW